MYEMTLKEALNVALIWLNHIQDYSEQAKDIMINTQPEGIGMFKLEKALSDSYMPLPQSIQEALNSGDGVYRP